MKKKIGVVALTGILTAGPAFASGWRIPEQSINSTALSNAYVASTPGADASYYNPANMSWLEDGYHSEISLTYINLASIEYTDNNSSIKNGGSRTENFAMPNLHFVSPAYNHFRFGLSVIYPAGLSKRWDAGFPKATAEDFTLKTYELNPTVSYKINEMISLGGGARIIHSTGKVKSTATAPFSGALSLLSRDLEGDTTEYGYNLALSVKPVKNLALAATYRSRVNLNEKGDATLLAQSGGITIGSYSGGAEVSVPVPAVLTLGAAYTCNDGRTTAEFTYDKTYWNAYDNLDFNYAGAFSGIPAGVAALTTFFDNPKQKNWTNTDAYRIGITHQLNNQWTVMAGFAIDKNPAPDSTLGFELPDSDAKIYSCGVRYKQSENLQFGAAYLFDDKESRTVTNASINGTFDNAAAHLISAGLQYRF